MQDCIFCKIINHEMPSSKVYEDASYIAILDLFPVSPGHTMLIPKIHHLNIFDTPPEHAGPVYPLLTKLARAIREATNCDGMNLVQNNNAVAGQMVFHSHIHLIPRYENDAIKIAAAGKQKAEQEMLSSMAEKIAAALKAI